MTLTDARSTPRRPLSDPDTSHDWTPQIDEHGMTRGYYCPDCLIAGAPVSAPCPDRVGWLRAEAQRLRDLVRHQRGVLHDEGLITDEEYAALAGDHGAVARLEGYDGVRAERDAYRDRAVEHTLALEKQNVALLRWQAVASDAHVDHICALVRSLAVSDETPRALRDLSAMGVEEEIRRVVAAERINREKSEQAARESRKAAETMEGRALDAERERDTALARVRELEATLTARDAECGRAYYDPFANADKVCRRPRGHEPVEGMCEGDGDTALRGGGQ